MGERALPPAVTGADERLDAIIARLDRIADLLTPAARPEPKDGETIGLREPAAADDGPPNQGPLTGIKLGPHRPERAGSKRGRR
jgi:hypothetical protein